MKQARKDRSKPTATRVKVLETKALPQKDYSHIGIKYRKRMKAKALQAAGKTAKTSNASKVLTVKQIQALSDKDRIRLLRNVLKANGLAV